AARARWAACPETGERRYRASPVASWASYGLPVVMQRLARRISAPTRGSAARESGQGRGGARRRMDSLPIGLRPRDMPGSTTSGRALNEPELDLLTSRPYRGRTPVGIRSVGTTLL